jgi:hypothetical protein
MRSWQNKKPKENHEMNAAAANGRNDILTTRDVRRFRHGTQIGADAFQRARTDAANPAQLLVVGEWSFLLARFDNASGQGFANAGKLRKFGPARRVDIDLKSRRLRRQTLEFDQTAAHASLRNPPQSHGNKRYADKPCDGRLIGTP